MADDSPDYVSVERTFHAIIWTLELRSKNSLLMVALFEYSRHIIFADCFIYFSFSISFVLFFDVPLHWPLYWLLGIMAQSPEDLKSEMKGGILVWESKNLINFSTCVYVKKKGQCPFLWPCSSYRNFCWILLFFFILKVFFL